MPKIIITIASRCLHGCRYAKFVGNEICLHGCWYAEFVGHNDLDRHDHCVFATHNGIRIVTAKARDTKKGRKRPNRDLLNRYWLWRGVQPHNLIRLELHVVVMLGAHGNA